MEALPVDLPTLPVEIVNHDSWWQTIITPSLVGALVGGVFALLGVYLTSRTTDKRERNKWRRDTLKQLCSDATVAALDLERRFIDTFTGQLVPIPDDEAIEPSIRRIDDVVETLRLVDATKLADACERLHAEASRMPVLAGLVLSSREQHGEILKNPAAEYDRIAAIRPLSERSRSFKDFREKREAAVRDLTEGVKTTEDLLKGSISELSRLRAAFITAAQNELTG